MELNFNHRDKTINIKSATENDAPLLLSWWNNGEIMAHAGFPLGLNIDLNKIKENIAKNNDNRQLLIIRCNNIAIGEMNFEIKNKIASFGIKICNKSFQNGGYGTVILKELFKFLFENKKVNKIVCDTNLNNTRAQFVYEKKLNMKKVKTEYNCFTNQIGEKCSAVFFEVTKQNFMKLIKEKE